MFNLDILRKYCLGKPGTSEDFPFDETTIVFRVGGKMFCISDTDLVPFRFNLKCDPERAIDLRERYENIIPGYHCNKKHWNTLQPDELIEDRLLYELIDHSYDLIFRSLKKADREKILVEGGKG